MTPKQNKQDWGMEFRKEFSLRNKEYISDGVTYNVKLIKFLSKLSRNIVQTRKQAIGEMVDKILAESYELLNKATTAIDHHICLGDFLSKLKRKKALNEN